MAAAPGLNQWLAIRWSRLNEPPRVTGVDLARGLAILGMFAAHMLALPEIEWTDASSWGSLAGGRSSILFATLAGVSLALITGSARRTAEDLGRARVRILVRAAAIWLIGLLLIATGVPVFVILPAYGILFLLAIPFLTLRPPALFAWAGALALIMPFVQVLLEALPVWSTPTGVVLAPAIGWAYPFPVWIAFVVCGIGVGRLDLRSWRCQALLLCAGGGAATVAYTLDAFTGADEASEVGWAAVWTARAHSSGMLEVVGSGGFAVAVIGLCLLLCRTWLRWVLLPLRATGSMPLSAYTAQVLVWAVVATSILGDAGDLGGFRNLHPFLPFAVWTIVGCTLWALLVGRGPLEWTLDAVSSVLSAPSTARADR